MGGNDVYTPAKTAEGVDWRELVQMCSPSIQDKKVGTYGVQMKCTGGVFDRGAGRVGSGGGGKKKKIVWVEPRREKRSVGCVKGRKVGGGNKSLSGLEKSQYEGGQFVGGETKEGGDN